MVPLEFAKLSLQLQLHQMHDLCEKMGLELYTITDLEFTKRECEKFW